MKQERYQKDISLRRLVFRVFMFLFFLASILIFVVWIAPLPNDKEITSNLKSVLDYDQIFNDQKKLEKDIVYVQKEIYNMNMAVIQVQKEAEVEGYIDRIKLFKRHSLLNAKKNKYHLEAAKTLKIYYETRKQLDTANKNSELIIQQLNECLANVPKGSLSGAPY